MVFDGKVGIPITVVPCGRVESVSVLIRDIFGCEHCVIRTWDHPQGGAADDGPAQTQYP